MNEETLLKKVEEIVGVPHAVYFNQLAESVKIWAPQVATSWFWQDAKKKLPNWEEEYSRLNDGAKLLPNNDKSLPEFKPKGHDSIKEKFFRVAKDEDGNFDFKEIWPGCTSLIPNIYDLVRTRIQCKWQDGVKFLSEKLIALAQEWNVYEAHRTHGGVEGYFAHHLYFWERNKEFLLHGKTFCVNICCEVQIATVVQTAIWDASHAVYDVYRGRISEPQEWQWNSDDPRFIPKQLGHLTHLADGLLVHHRKNLAREVKRQSLRKLLSLEQNGKDKVHIVIPTQKRALSEPYVGYYTSYEEAMAQATVEGKLTEYDIPFETVKHDNLAVNKRNVPLILLGGQLSNSVSEDLQKEEAYKAIGYSFERLDDGRFIIRRPDGSEFHLPSPLHDNPPLKPDDMDFAILSVLTNPWRSNGLPSRVCFLAGYYALGTWAAADLIMNHTSVLEDKLSKQRGWQLDDKTDFSCIIRCKRVSSGRPLFVDIVESW